MNDTLFLVTWFEDKGYHIRHQNIKRTMADALELKAHLESVGAFSITIKELR